MKSASRNPTPNSIRKFHSKPQRGILLFNPGLGDSVLEEIQEIIATPWFPEKSSTNPPVLEVHPERIRVDNIFLLSFINIAYRSTTIKDAYLYLGRMDLGSFLKTPEIIKKAIDSCIPGASDSFPWTIRCLIRKNSLTEEEILSKFLNTDIFPRSIASDEPPLRLLLSIRENNLEYYVGIRNSPNYQRGFRIETPQSYPLSEDIASVLIREMIGLSPKKRTLYYIPFSGTGTLAWEAIIQEMKIPPVLWKIDLPVLAEVLGWQEAHNHCIRRTTSYLQNLSHSINVGHITDSSFISQYNFQCNFECILSDWHETAIGSAQENIDRMMKMPHPQLGFLESLVKIRRSDFFQDIPEEISKPGRTIFLPIHPPYGIRTGRKESSYSFYSRLVLRIGEIHSRIHSDSKISGFILTPDEDGIRGILSNIGKNFSTRILNFSQGKLSVRAVFFW